MTRSVAAAPQFFENLSDAGQLTMAMEVHMDDVYCLPLAANENILRHIVALNLPAWETHGYDDESLVVTVD